MFYLVSSGLPAAVVLLKSGLTSGLISRALLVSLSPSPSLRVTRALLVWLGLLPSATCLGYVLPRISSSYFWDVTLVSADGAFPRSSIIDHCLILAFRIHLMLLWPVMMLWFLTVICSGPHLQEVLSQSYLPALRLAILGSQGQPAGNFALNIHVSF